MCEDVRRGCEPLLKLLGYSWPDEVNCDKFPIEAPCLNETGIVATPTTTGTDPGIVRATTAQPTMDENSTTTTTKTFVIGKKCVTKL